MCRKLAAMSSCLRNSRSVLSQLLRRYKPAQPPLARFYQRAPAAPLVPAACPRSQPPTHLTRRWRHEPRKVAAAGFLAYSTVLLFPYAAGYAVLDAFAHEEIVPYTNRVHRVMFSPLEEREFGDIGFDGIKKELGDKILGPYDPDTVRVRLIARDLLNAAYRVLLTRSSSDDGGGPSSLKDSGLDPNGSQNKQGKVAVPPQTTYLDELNWEVIVVENKRANAYSKWGGKIIVNTGLLECLDSDAEIATILAHEIGHIVAKHASEFVGIAQFIPFLYKEFLRRNEIEADHIAVMLLAAAGFDPRVVPRVYQKRGQTVGDSALDDYTVSHPSCKTRSQLLLQSKVMEEALELYHEQVCTREGIDRPSFSFWWQVSAGPYSKLNL